MYTKLLKKMLDSCILCQWCKSNFFFYSESLIQCKSQVNMWIIELIKMAFSSSLEERIIMFYIFSTFSFRGKIIYQSNYNLCVLCGFLWYFIKQTLVSTVWRQNGNSHFYLILTSTRRIFSGMNQFLTSFSFSFLSFVILLSPVQT